MSKSYRSDSKYQRNRKFGKMGKRDKRPRTIDEFCNQPSGSFRKFVEETQSAN